MTGAKTSLEIEIRTMLADSGLAATEDQLKRVMERTQELRHANDQQAQSTSGVTDAMKEQAQVALRQIEANEQSATAKRKAADASKLLSRELGLLKASGESLGQLFRGALSGNILQVGQGLLGLSRAATQAGNSVRGLFAQFARGGLIGAAIAAPVITGLKIIQDKIAENEKAIKKFYDEAAAAADAYRERSAKVAAGVEQDLAKQMQAVEKLSAAYARLLSQIDAAEQRSSALNAANLERANAQLDADEAAALARARTPEAREQVQREFGVKRASLKAGAEAGSLDNAGFSADVRQRAADRQITESSARLRELDVQETQLKADFENATAIAGKFELGSAAQREAQAKARTAQDALKKFQESSKPVREALSQEISGAYTAIDSARTDREVTGIKRETQQLSGQARISQLATPSSDVQERLTSASGRVREVQSAIAAEEERALRSTKFGEQANTEGLQRELAAARAAEAEANKAFVEDAKLRRKESEQIKAQIKAQKQNTTGGG